MSPWPLVRGRMVRCFSPAVKESPDRRARVRVERGAGELSRCRPWINSARVRDSVLTWESGLVEGDDGRLSHDCLTAGCRSGPSRKVSCGRIAWRVWSLRAGLRRNAVDASPLCSLGPSPLGNHAPGAPSRHGCKCEHDPGQLTLSNSFDNAIHRIPLASCMGSPDSMVAESASTMPEESLCLLAASTP